MGKPQTFDIFAVSIPDSNVQMAVARIMVGADRYLSMQDALDQVKSPPVLLFKNTELRVAEERIAKLKALGVGFRVVRADDGTEDDSIMRDDELPGGAPAASVEKNVKEQPPAPAAEAAISDILNPDGASGGMPPLMSIQDVISRRRRHAQADAGAADASAGGRKNTDGFTGFGSASGHYGGGGGSGIRAGVGMFDELKKSEAASRKKKRLVSIITAAVIVVIALLFVLQKETKFQVKKITIQTSAGPKGVKREAANKPKGNTDDAEGGGAAAGGGLPPEPPFGKATPAPERRFDGANNKPRSDVNKRQKQQANNYIDSAKANGSAPEKQVAFYKIAISFNRYNLQAWHGLLQAYREMNDANGVRSTEAQMKEIFGDGVNSVNAAVTQFGDIVDAYANENGVYRVEYKTKKTSEDEIKREVLNLTRAVRNACKCRSISIHASTASGGGLTATSSAETPVHSLPEFLRQADIRWSD